MADPLPKFAKVDPNNPEAFAQCDRCSFWYNRGDLAFQYEWNGIELYNTGLLVCTTGNRCYDKPFEQLRTIILPPDPPPILNARTVNFAYEEQTPRIIQFGPGTIFTNENPWGAGPMMIRATQDGEQARVLQYLTVLQPGASTG